jgi:hypothetical protein
MKYKIPIKREHWPLVGFVALFAVIGTILLSSSHAATPYISLSASNGTLGGNATQKTDSSKEPYVQFGAASTGGGGTAGGGVNMVVGLNAGGWGAAGAQTVSTAVKYVRLDTPTSESITDFSKVGVKLDLDFSGDLNYKGGDYNPGGVSAINASDWASSAVSTYQSMGCTPTECPMIEVLNEPGGNWFWGGSANSQQNATAYANLVKTAYTAFHSAYPSNSPAILASYDGGSAGSTSWGQEWWSSSVAPYVDGIVMHPYGGDGNPGNPSQSKLGSRSSVTAAHSQTGKPVYATEIGFPTNNSGNTPVTDDNGQGDSLQWPQSNANGAATQGDQCDNVYNFINWSRSTGYVNAVYIFGYADYTSGSTPMDYGMFNSSGSTAKPAFGALKAAANSQPNPCPSPLSY